MSGGTDSMVKVRQAGGDDVGCLASLFEQAVADLSGQRGGRELLADLSEIYDTNLTVKSGRFRLVSELLASQPGSVWVALGGEEVAQGGSALVGFAWGRLGQVSEEGPRLGTVELLYVVPKARGSAAGRELLAGLTGWLSKRGCAAIDGNALPGDRFVKGLFEESGFKARLVVMSLPT
jgi:GNAT superfamily N-acetyltransferase